MEDLGGPRPMIPVMQTRLMAPRDEQGRPLAAPGNCWAACIASILELPIDQVPDEAEFWQSGMTDRQCWRPFAEKMHALIASRGFVLIELARHHLIFLSDHGEHWNQVYNIMAGQSPRNPS